MLKHTETQPYLLSPIRASLDVWNDYMLTMMRPEGLCRALYYLLLLLLCCQKRLPYSKSSDDGGDEEAWIYTGVQS